MNDTDDPRLMGDERSPSKQADLNRFARETLDALSAHLAIVDAEGKIIAVNRAWREFAAANFAGTANVCEGASYLAVVDAATGDWSEGAGSFAAGIRSVLRGERPEFTLEYPCHSPNEKRWFCGRVTRLGTNGAPCAVVAHENITERKLAEEALWEREERLGFLLTRAPAVIYTRRASSDFGPTFVSENVRSLLGYRAGEITSNPAFWSEHVHPDDSSRVLSAIATLFTKEHHVHEYRFRHRDGTYRWLRDEVILVRDAARQPTEMIGSWIDITERRLAEEALAFREVHLRTLIDTLPDLVWLKNTEGVYLSCNRRFESFIGAPAQDIVGRTDYDFANRELAADFLARDLSAIAAGNPTLNEEEVVFAEDGHVEILETIKMPMHDRDGRLIGVLGVGRDITKRKQAAEELRESEAHYRALVEGLPGIVYSFSHKSGGMYYSPYVKTALGYSPEQLYAQPWQWHSSIHPDDLPRVEQAIRESTGGTAFRVEYRIRDALGAWRWLDDRSFKCRVDSDDVIVEGLAMDITESRLGEESLSRRLAELESLRVVDRAIVTSIDLRATLNVLLDQAMTLLQVDAAAVLLPQPSLLTLEYAAWRGFRLHRMEDINVPLGESFSGRAALHHRSVRVSQPIPAQENAQIAALWAAEGFFAYHGVPLFVQGEIKGVLEVYNRSPVDADPGWEDFLDTLAGQAAIAIANAQLFDGLQRANTEMGLAYNATIAGWSRAMDLRDEETEGHTQRVTVMCLRLARALGVIETDLVHIWRGSMLHDMGKLGVPDSILLKPGALTDEEWVIMRRHPQFAYDMFSPIEFLRPALDIPFCHHEKWDGTGYPRQLAGEQIPPAARLFAVVDVWDALISARPYRHAWSREKALAHISEQSGKQFEPRVVEAFLKIV